MKIKKVKKFKYKLLKLRLIKSRIYKIKIKKNNFNDSINIILEQIELHLKKILQIIYEYHIYKKQIIFIDFPLSFQKKFIKILNKTKHFSISKSKWINGILSNKFAIFQNLNFKRLKSNNKNQIKNIKSLLKVKKKPDLVIIFNQKINSNILKEIYNLKIPIIVLNNNLYFNNKSTYFISGDFKIINKQISNVFFLILYSIFKRSFLKSNIKKSKI